MSSQHQGLIPPGLQNCLMRILDPLIRRLAEMGIHPNYFTVGGALIAVCAALAVSTDRLVTGGILILLGGLFDAIDGSLARCGGKVSPFGALLDSSLDRYAEFIIFLGIGILLVSQQDYLTAVAAFFALCGSIMVSYTRARAESLGFDAKTGWMQRPERILCLGLGALIHVIALQVAVWAVAVMANYTALQRLRHAYRQRPGNAEQNSAGGTEC